jgi:ferredoxin
MDVNLVKLVFFSPTKTTDRILVGIAQGIQVDIVERLDLTPPEARTREFEEMRGELVIIGAPVYGGRIPPEAVYRLRRIKGNGTPAGVVAVYGNRAYEDALLELRDLAVEQGFRPIAVCATVCPTAAIAVGDTVRTDQEACILCSACVKNCPTGARAWDNRWTTWAAKMLSTNYRERREPEVFL